MSGPQRFQHFRSATVFGWSESRPGDAVYEAAREVACLLAKHGLTVVSVGFEGEMEAAVRGAREGGGNTMA
jgi:predicted Rossmann-fold nucleotide-binding protein